MSLGIALNKGIAKDLPFLPFAFFWAFALHSLTQIQFVFVEVENDWHRKELQSQHAAAFQALKLGNAHRVVMVGPVADGEFVDTERLRIGLSPPVVVNIYEMDPAIAHESIDFGIVSVEEEQRGISQIDNELPRDVDTMACGLDA